MKLRTELRKSDCYANTLNLPSQLNIDYSNPSLGTSSKSAVNVARRREEAGAFLDGSSSHHVRKREQPFEPYRVVRQRNKSARPTEKREAIELKQLRNLSLPATLFVIAQAVQECA